MGETAAGSYADSSYRDPEPTARDTARDVVPSTPKGAKVAGPRSTPTSPEHVNVKPLSELKSVSAPTTPVRGTTAQSPIHSINLIPTDLENRPPLNQTEPRPKKPGSLLDAFDAAKQGGKDTSHDEHNPQLGTAAPIKDLLSPDKDPFAATGGVIPNQPPIAVFNVHIDQPAHISAAAAQPERKKERLARTVEEKREIVIALTEQFNTFK